MDVIAAKTKKGISNCNMSDVELKKYLSSPYLEIILGLFNIGIYNEYENFEEAGNEAEQKREARYLNVFAFDS